MLDKQRLRTFLLGGAAGILAGILLAPRSGKELRGSVKERAGEARERGRETLFEARERVQERLSVARESPRPEPSSDARPGDAATPPRRRAPTCGTPPVGGSRMSPPGGTPRGRRSFAGR